MLQIEYPCPKKFTFIRIVTKKNTYKNTRIRRNFLILFVGSLVALEITELNLFRLYPLNFHLDFNFPRKAPIIIFYLRNYNFSLPRNETRIPLYRKKRKREYKIKIYKSNHVIITTTKKRRANNKNTVSSSSGKKRKKNLGQIRWASVLSKFFFLSSPPSLSLSVIIISSKSHSKCRTYSMFICMHVSLSRSELRSVFFYIRSCLKDYPPSKISCVTREKFIASACALSRMAMMMDVKILQL